MYGNGDSYILFVLSENYDQTLPDIHLSEYFYEAAGTRGQRANSAEDIGWKALICLLS